MVTTPLPLPAQSASVNVPLPAPSAQIDRNNAIFSGLVVDLKQCMDAILHSGETPFSIFIYADQLRIPKAFHWSLADQTMMIVAREIRIEGGAKAKLTLDFKGDLHSDQTQSHTQLLCFTQKLRGTIKAIGAAVRPRLLGAVDVTNINSRGVKIGIENHEFGATKLEGIHDELLRDGMPLRRILQTMFLKASTHLDTEPRTAISMFQWIAETTANAKSARDLGVQSANMSTLLRAEVGSAGFVPYLAAETYGKIATAYIAEANVFEQQYERFADDVTSKQDRIASAELMLKKDQDQSDFVLKLVHQAEADLKSAEETMEKARANLKDQQKTVAQKKAAFEVGIEKWKTEKELEAAFQILTAIGTFAVSIGAMMVGDEAAAGGAVAGVSEAIEGAEAAEKVAEEASKIQKVASELKKVMGTLKKIGKTVAALGTLGKGINDAGTSLSDQLNLADQLHEVGQSDADVDIDGTEYWDIFDLRVKDAMKIAEDESIDSAVEYRQELQILAIYGQGMTAAQTSFIKKTQELFHVKQQLTLAKQRNERDQAFIKQLHSDEANLEDMKQAFYERYLNMKRFIFFALQNYRLSYRYWALRDSSIQPKVGDRVDELGSGLETLTQMKLDNASAVNHFGSQPETMAGATIRIDSPKTIEKLIQTGKTSFVIDPSNAIFEDNDRVRVTQVLVYIEGLTRSGGNAAPNVIRITNSGHYRDRFQGDTLQFTSKPFSRLIKYSLETTPLAEKIEIDDKTTIWSEAAGELAEFVKFAYFVPTPFTEWKLDIDKSKHDLSKIKSIVISFSGSFVPN